MFNTFDPSMKSWPNKTLIISEDVKVIIIETIKDVTIRKIDIFFTLVFSSSSETLCPFIIAGNNEVTIVVGIKYHNSVNLTATSYTPTDEAFM